MRDQATQRQGRNYVLERNASREVTALSHQDLGIVRAHRVILLVVKHRCPTAQRCCAQESLSQRTSAKEQPFRTKLSFWR